MRHGLETVLKATVDVEIVFLGIVLRKVVHDILVLKLISILGEIRSNLLDP
jgi:hypothetical protein